MRFGSFTVEDDHLAFRTPILRKTSHKPGLSVSLVLAIGLLVTPQDAAAAFLTYTDPSVIRVHGYGVGNPFFMSDNVVVEAEQQTPISQLEAQIDSVNPDPRFISFNASGRGKGIASYGDIAAPYGWSEQSSVRQLAFVYAAASSFGYGVQVSADAFSRLRILPEAGESFGQSITLNLMLAEGVWSNYNGSGTSSRPSVSGRVDVFGSEIHPTITFSAGHGLPTFVILRDVQARIGDYITLSVEASAGDFSLPIGVANDHEVAAFLFAEVPSSGIRFFSNFTSESDLSQFMPNAPRAQVVPVPESNPILLSCFGILTLAALGKIRRNRPLSHPMR